VTFSYMLRTRYAETGQDGIIHHSCFVVYLEVARLEFFKMIGCDINELEKKKIFCPVIDLSLKYLKPLYSQEDIIIQVAVDTYSKVRFTLRYHILRSDECVAMGTVSQCFLNGSFKPIAIPQEVLEKYRNFDLGSKAETENAKCAQ
jgi:acyl-CoA thioester hydrolase